MDWTQSQNVKGFECHAKKVGLYAAESGDPWEDLSREVVCWRNGSAYSAWWDDRDTIQRQGDILGSNS